MAETHIPRISMEAVRIAADTLGAAAFVDIPSLEGGAHLRRLLLSYLGE